MIDKSWQQTVQARCPIGGFVVSLCIYGPIQPYTVLAAYYPYQHMIQLEIDPQHAKRQVLGFIDVKETPPGLHVSPAFKWIRGNQDTEARLLAEALKLLPEHLARALSGQGAAAPISD